MIIAVQSKNSPGCQNVIARFCSAPCTITQFWPTSCSVTSRNITNVHYTCHTNHSVPSNDAEGELHVTTTYTLKFLPFKLCANAMWKKVGFCNLNMLNGNWNQCTSIDGLHREAKASELIEMNLPLLHEIFTTPLKFRKPFFLNTCLPTQSDLLLDDPIWMIPNSFNTKVL